MTDLTFIELGNKDTVHGLINFRKRELIAEIIMEIQMYQQGNSQLNFKPISRLVTLLNQLAIIDEEKLYQISLLREPRGAERSDLL